MESPRVSPDAGALFLGWADPLQGHEKSRGIAEILALLESGESPLNFLLQNNVFVNIFEDLIGFST